MKDRRKKRPVLGHIKLHRRAMDSRIWRSLRDWRLAETLVLLANWKTGEFYPRRGKPFTVRRGELITSVATLSRKSVLTIQNVRTSLKHLVAFEFITDEARDFYRVIRIINFAKYQDAPNSMTSPVGRKRSPDGRTPTRRGANSNKVLSTGFPDVEADISTRGANNTRPRNQQSPNTDRRRTLRSSRTYKLYCRICGTTAARLNKDLVCAQCLRCALCGEADPNARPEQRPDRTWRMVCGSCRGRKPRKGNGFKKLDFKVRGAGGT